MKLPQTVFEFYSAFSFSPNMTFLSLIMCFIVPFSHPLKQTISSMSTFWIINETSLTRVRVLHDTSLTHYVFYSALPSPVTTNNEFSVNFLDYK
jgi:hypothetical protein